MRKPNVKNKYNLKVSDLRRLKLVSRDRVCEPLFWRNGAIKGWCIIETTAKTREDSTFGTCNEYWIGVLDKNDKIRVTFDCHGGMCSYKFKEFYDYREIENEHDLRVQELFLEKINYLLDEGIFKIN